MALQTFLTVQIRAALTAALDLVTKSASLDQTFSDELATGTGADQADVVFSDARSTATNEDLDFAAGGLLDNLGAAFAPAKIKLIAVWTPANNPGNITISRPANGVPFLSASGDAHVITPGGLFLAFAPGAAGICSVTAGTGDLINFASSAGTSAYNIVVVGTSA